MTEAWRAPSGAYNMGVDLVDRHRPAGRGGKLAFVDPARRLSFDELEEQTNRFGRGLLALGVRPEQRVVLIMLDTVDFPVAFLGAIKAGVVAVPVNTLLSAEQWHFMIEDSRAAAVVVSAELWTRAEPAVERVRSKRSLEVIVAGGRSSVGLELGALLAQADPEPLGVTTHADEVAFWLYTSGSTGTPKAARHVHASPAHTAEHYGRQVLGIRDDDVMFSAAKLFFAYGLGNGLSFPLFVGATTILLPERPTPEAVLAVLALHQPTLFFGVPTLYAGLLAGTGLGPGAGSKRLRACVSAGEALPDDIGRRWRQRVGVEILDGIGSTELLHIFISNRVGEIRGGSSGQPVPGYEARVLDERGEPVPVGEIGELVVRGPTAADGYWNQRERSRRTFAGEWTHTGDKYRADPEGFYYYCGRTDDMFKVSGIWVAPFEVESALVAHPAVVEAAVVGREDDDGLVKPSAFVVLGDGVAPSEQLFEELRAHVKAAAGPWKYPRWIEAVPELPKTATGKIQRFKLRA